MDRLPPLAFALLLVLAGCASPLGGPGTETESVTPAAVPTDAQTPMRPEPPDDGGEGFDAWTEAHWAVLDNTTYEYRLDVSIRRGVQEFQNQTSVAVVGTNRSRFLERTVSGSITSETWSNESHVVSVRREDGETTYEIIRANRWHDDRTRSLLNRLFSFVVVETISETESGYLVVGDITPQARQRLIPDDVTVRNVTVRIAVRDDGLIRSFHFGWSGTDDGTPRWSRGTLSFDTAYEQVPRPDWVDLAFQNTTVVTPTAPA